MLNQHISSNISSVYKAFTALSLLLFTVTTNSAEYQYSYPVTGSNAKELVEEMKTNSLSPDGAFGFTELNTNVSWTALVGASGECEIETVNFSYDITIHMPDWVDKHTAKQCLQENWMSVWLKIQIHEERHRELYRLLDASEIEQRISAIRPKASCAALKKAVNDEVERILDENDKLHDDFHASDTPPVLWEC